MIHCQMENEKMVDELEDNSPDEISKKSTQTSGIKMHLINESNTNEAVKKENKIFSKPGFIGPAPNFKSYSKVKKKTQDIEPSNSSNPQDKILSENINKSAEYVKKDNEEILNKHIEPKSFVDQDPKKQKNKFQEKEITYGCQAKPEDGKFESKKQLTMDVSQICLPGEESSSKNSVLPSNKKEEVVNKKNTFCDKNTSASKNIISCKNSESDKSFVSNKSIGSNKSIENKKSQNNQHQYEVNLSKSSNKEINLKNTASVLPFRRQRSEEEKDFIMLVINKNDFEPLAIPKPPPASLIQMHQMQNVTKAFKNSSNLKTSTADTIATLESSSAQKLSSVTIPSSSPKLPFVSTSNISSSNASDMKASVLQVVNNSNVSQLSSVSNTSTASPDKSMFPTAPQMMQFNSPSPSMVTNPQNIFSPVAMPLPVDTSYPPPTLKSIPPLPVDTSCPPPSLKPIPPLQVDTSCPPPSLKSIPPFPPPLQVPPPNVVLKNIPTVHLTNVDKPNHQLYPTMPLDNSSSMTPNQPAYQSKDYFKNQRSNLINIKRDNITTEKESNLKQKGQKKRKMPVKSNGNVNERNVQGTSSALNVSISNASSTEGSTLKKTSSNENTPLLNIEKKDATTVSIGSKSNVKQQEKKELSVESKKGAKEINLQGASTASNASNSNSTKGSTEEKNSSNKNTPLLNIEKNDAATVPIGSKSNVKQQEKKELSVESQTGAKEINLRGASVASNVSNSNSTEGSTEQKNSSNKITLSVNIEKKDLTVSNNESNMKQEEKKASVESKNEVKVINILNTSTALNVSRCDSSVESNVNLTESSTTDLKLIEESNVKNSLTLLEDANESVVKNDLNCDSITVLESNTSHAESDSNSTTAIIPASSESVMKDNDFKRFSDKDVNNTSNVSHDTSNDDKCGNTSGGISVDLEAGAKDAEEENNDSNSKSVSIVDSLDNVDHNATKMSPESVDFASFFKNSTKPKKSISMLSNSKDIDSKAFSTNVSLAKNILSAFDIDEDFNDKSKKLKRDVSESKSILNVGDSLDLSSDSHLSTVTKTDFSFESLSEHLLIKPVEIDENSDTVNVFTKSVEESVQFPSEHSFIKAVEMDKNNDTVSVSTKSIEADNLEPAVLNSDEISLLSNVGIDVNKSSDNVIQNNMDPLCDKPICEKLNVSSEFVSEEQISKVVQNSECLSKDEVTEFSKLANESISLKTSNQKHYINTSNDRNSCLTLKIDVTEASVEISDGVKSMHLDSQAVGLSEDLLFSEFSSNNVLKPVSDEKSVQENVSVLDKLKNENVDANIVETNKHLDLSDLHVKSTDSKCVGVTHLKNTYDSVNFGSTNQNEYVRENVTEENSTKSERSISDPVSNTGEIKNVEANVVTDEYLDLSNLLVENTDCEAISDFKSTCNLVNIGTVNQNEDASVSVTVKNSNGNERSISDLVLNAGEISVGQNNSEAAIISNMPSLVSLDVDVSGYLTEVKSTSNVNSSAAESNAQEQSSNLSVNTQDHQIMESANFGERIKLDSSTIEKDINILSNEDMKNSDTQISGCEVNLNSKQHDCAEFYEKDPLSSECGQLKADCTLSQAVSSVDNASQNISLLESAFFSDLAEVNILNADLIESTDLPPILTSDSESVCVPCAPISNEVSLENPDACKPPFFEDNFSTVQENAIALSNQSDLEVCLKPDILQGASFNEKLEITEKTKMVITMNEENKVKPMEINSDDLPEGGKEIQDQSILNFCSQVEAVEVKGVSETLTSDPVTEESILQELTARMEVELEKNAATQETVAGEIEVDLKKDQEGAKEDSNVLESDIVQEQVSEKELLSSKSEAHVKKDSDTDEYESEKTP